MTLMSERPVREKAILDRAASQFENLNILEKKIAQLIELVKAEKALNASLMEEKAALTTRLEMLENSLLSESRSIDEFNQEREMTRAIVDELINSIDQLVEQEQR